MGRAIRIHRYGGPEVLQWEEVALGPPGPGEVLVRHTAIGVNFIDIYNRTGLYPLPSLPAVLGREAAGIVVATGSGVDSIRVGQRVAYVLSLGAYAEERILPAESLIPLPEDVSDRQAAAMLLKGLTAHYLLRKTYPVRPGDTILFHAAAGGVGLIACQWAKRLGATVIGTVSTPEKAEIARNHGCDHAIVYTKENFVERTREITGGRGVPVVYDSVGRDTFEGSLDCLAPRGLLVSFGQSSGPVPPLSLHVLADKGSLYVTRPTLATYVGSPEELRSAADELFQMVRSGAIRIEIGQLCPLSEAARAQSDLEARRTIGATVLLP
jgi:NADPH2:quinone reductase